MQWTTIDKMGASVIPFVILSPDPGAGQRTYGLFPQGHIFIFVGVFFSFGWLKRWIQRKESSHFSLQQNSLTSPILSFLSFFPLWTLRLYVLSLERKVSLPIKGIYSSCCLKQINHQRYVQNNVLFNFLVLVLLSISLRNFWLYSNSPLAGSAWGTHQSFCSFFWISQTGLILPSLFHMLFFSKVPQGHHRHTWMQVPFQQHLKNWSTFP